jgi:hypothetical protein
MNAASERSEQAATAASASSYNSSLGGAFGDLGAGHTPQERAKHPVPTRPVVCP